ncbi:hypothetical protein [Brachybacterium huguangmaarense]
MEINPSLARLRILEQQDSVQMQREAAPDDELAGCPGCPYFWTCPVPHRAANVTAHEDIEPDELADQLPERSAYRPRDADDIGWTDEWVDGEDEELETDGELEDGGEGPDDFGGLDERSDEPPAHRPERRGWFRRRT